MRFLPVLLVCGLLLASSSAYAGGNGRGRGPPVPIGAFELSTASQTATGEHVSFAYGQSGINDFTVDENKLFDIRVVGALRERSDDNDDDDRSDSPRTQGSQLKVRMLNFTFTAHDNPTAASKLSVKGVAVVAFEEGAIVSREGTKGIRFSIGDLTGALRGEGLALSGRNVTTRGEVLVILDAPRGPFEESHRDLGRAIARGHVGAEATLNRADDDKVSEDFVSYGNVTMTTVKAERGNLTILIDGHGFDGRVLVFNIDGRVLGADHADKLNILLDNASVAPASNLTDILDPDDDGFTPEYYIVYDPQTEAFQLMVTLPHYSIHTLSITTPFVLPPPSVTIGILAGALLLVPTALLLFRRK